MSTRPKLLLLHGWTLDHRSMLKQAQALSPHFQVINPDRPGYGSSDQTPNLAHEHLFWLEYIQQKFRQEPVHLLGVSQGARIALRMAATQPSKIASIAVHGAAVDGVKAPTQQQAIPLDRYIELALDDQLDVLKKEWLDHPMMLEGLTPEQLSEIEQIVTDYCANDLKTPQGHDFSFSSTITRSLQLYEGPVLVTTGSLEADERQYHARWLRDNLSNLRFESLQGAGHLANFSHASVFNAILEQFYTDASIISPRPDR